MPTTKLNFIPATFSADQVRGFVLKYENADQLSRLQNEYIGQYVIRRDAKLNVIRAVPIADSVQPLPNNPILETFPLQQNYHLFKGLLEDGVRRFLRSRQWDVPEFGRLLIRVERESEDLLPAAIG